MRIISKSPDETLYIGRDIARNLKPSDIICLFGDLGSGKTVLAKGIGLGLGVRAGEINSPSFVLLRQYNEGRVPLYHFDLYRLKGPRDIMSLGYEEYLYGDGITVIEWPDRLKYLMPKECLKVRLFISVNKQRRL